MIFGYIIPFSKECLEVSTCCSSFLYWLKHCCKCSMQKMLNELEGHVRETNIA